MSGDRGHVARDKMLLFPDANNQRRAATRPDDYLGVVSTNDGDRISTDDFVEGIGHGLRERVLGGTITGGGGRGSLQPHVMLTNQVREHFGIRFGVKYMARRGQALLEAIVVFDHAVMNDRQPAAGVEVRMRVLVAGCAMRSPPGMPDAGVPGNWIGFDRKGEPLIDAPHFL